MLPAVKHYTARTKIGVTILQTVKTIGNAIATLIAFCYHGTTYGGEVRTILV